jgi:hypothetical protein
MADTHQRKNPHQESSERSVRIGDCRVWAEINYLDSPTDYREYLRESRNSSHQIQSAALTMLDSRNFRLREDLPRLLLLLLAIASLLVSAYLLYRVLDVL